MVIDKDTANFQAVDFVRRGTVFPSVYSDRVEIVKTKDESLIISTDGRAAFIAELGHEEEPGLYDVTKKAGVYTLSPVEGKWEYDKETANYRGPNDSRHPSVLRVTRGGDWDDFLHADAPGEFSLLNKYFRWPRGFEMAYALARVGICVNDKYLLPFDDCNLWEGTLWAGDSNRQILLRGKDTRKRRKGSFYRCALIMGLSREDAFTVKGSDYPDKMQKKC